MKKQLPAILLVVVCIALSIAYYHSRNTVKQLQRQTAGTATHTASEADLSAVDESAAALPAPPTGDAEILQDAPAEADRENKQTGGRRMMQNMARMLENPTMNKVMEASQRGAVGALYSDLIEYLNLSKEETDYFMDLLMYRQMKQMETGMKMMSGSLSGEEKQSLSEEINQARKIVTEEMRQFLNNDADFAEFEFYEKTMGERMMLSQMDSYLAGSGAELSDATYRELLGVMHDERTRFEFSSDLHDQNNTDMSPERFSRQNLEHYANDLRSLNDRIYQKARTMLAPEQYEAFESSLKAFTEMQLSQLELAGQMFGGGN